jgi:hypothetical protein
LRKLAERLLVDVADVHPRTLVKERLGDHVPYSGGTRRDEHPQSRGREFHGDG